MARESALLPIALPKTGVSLLPAIMIFSGLGAAAGWALRRIAR